MTRFLATQIMPSRNCALLICFLLYSPLALAYIGPGLGAGMVATVLGLLVGLMMLLVGIVWYPLKRLFRRLKLRKAK